MHCSLVHKLDHEQPKTTKELLNIATWHALGEEAVGAAFTLVNTGMSIGIDQATPTNAIVKSTERGAKGGKKGQKCHPRHLAIVTNNGGIGEEI
jgi:hypothetical protein